MKHTFYILLIAFLGFSACKKDNYIDPREQFGRDTISINQFIEGNNIDAIKDPYGVYYQIVEPGTGTVTPNASYIVTVKYTGRLLNGTVFDQSDSLRYPLAGLIAGWQIGVPKIKEGGKVRLLIPSYYGYGSNANGGIPANSVLDFDIELKKVE